MVRACRSLRDAWKQARPVARKTLVTAVGISTQLLAARILTGRLEQVAQIVVLVGTVLGVHAGGTVKQEPRQ